MAKKRSDTVEVKSQLLSQETADDIGSDDGMAAISEAVAVVNNAKIREAFLTLTNGEKYYAAFRRTMREEITNLITGNQDEKVGLLEDRIEQMGEDVEQLSEFVRSLTNERVFAVLDVISRNFGGKPIPPASSTQTKAQASAETADNVAPLAQAANETPTQRNDQVSTMTYSNPGRGGRLPGFY
ncbi:hypothetical protein UFOVP244_50 [uncultured Caudovirales phage]|uniref:Uncharacterized protein n=1 Tax=uncultured Caudovirales phage TaxID=2100421 RepID=A0A6J7WXV2_9CAUD|nr:hypothetical protein UFOVP244_50 [uncultured Caudovirales phage]